MRFRNSGLRTKITAMLVSLAALWAFAAWVTAREGINLLFVTTLDSVVAPSDPMLVDLQTERRLTVVYLSSPTQQGRDALNAQRARTDKTVAVVLKRAASGAIKRAADDALERRIGEAVALLRRLPNDRQAIDNGTMDRDRALDAYSAINEANFRMYDAMLSLDDKGFADTLRAQIATNRTWELLSREDALVAGMLTSGRLSATNLQWINQTVAIRRFAFDRAMADLRTVETRQYSELISNRKLAEVRAMEDLLLRTRPGQRPRLTGDQWRATIEPALAQMRQIVQAAGDRLVERATPIAVWVVIRLMLAGGLGLIAVIASVVVSITTARALVRQLERLRGAAWELAEQRLPGVVERLGHGEKVDVAAEAPPLEFGTDEIGQVGRAFNAVQETALRTAVEQAELRRGIRDVLLSLARRTQTLVHRQLSLLDMMERRRDLDPKELEELFRLDHLATRMRRNAENLIVLSGAIPARGWRRSVPMVDVVRAAVGEVEDYTRVQVLPFGPVELTGRAVGDVTHLLAELIENAVSFSPPDTVVQIGGHLVANGFAIDIEDRGLGMTDEKLIEINGRIADPPEFNLQSSVQLGLFVVGKLAERYGLQVMLKRSAYGGTTAVVVVPRELVVEDSSGMPQPEPDAEAAVAAPQDGPRPVAVGTTTENGLAVRQPTMVGAGPMQGGATDTAPALVAVPDPGRTPAGADGRPLLTGAELRPGTGELRPGTGEPHGAGEFRPGAGEPPYGTGEMRIGGPAGPGQVPPYARQAPAGPGAPTVTPGLATDGDPAHGQAAVPDDAGGGGIPGRSSTVTPEDLPPVPDIDSTPSGLPVRVPQANLAPPLRSAEPATTEEGAEAEGDQGRSPAEIQRIMGSFQRGTRRGRSDAARAAGGAEGGRSDTARTADRTEGEEDH